MKNPSIAIFSIVLMAATATFGQSLQKGNLVGLHTLTVHLDPDVTMNQYKDFVLNKMIPSMDKNNPNSKTYLLQGVRGENENSLGFLFTYTSEAERNKYWNDDGTPTEMQTAISEKMQQINEEGSKLGTWTSDYTDWVVQ